MGTPDEMGIDFLVTLYVSLFGLAIGSFLNVCIYRLPRHRSLLYPSSRCPWCGHSLGGRDLVPVFSYLLLKGRCRYCGRRIGWRYPLVEALTAVLFAGMFLHFGLSLLLVKYLFLTAVLIVVSFIDLEHRIVPDRITLFTLGGGAVLDLLARDLSLRAALLGLAVPAAFLLLLALVSRGGMGAGDVKLAAVTGLFLGWPQSGLALFAACMIGGTAALVLLALGLKGRKEAIPFGPFLAAGVLVSVFWGQALLAWYLGRL